MRNTPLFIAAAALEAGAGLALLALPSPAVELLTGGGLSSPPALVLGRVAGAALLSLGVACWLARNAANQNGLVAGLLIYNAAVPALLLHGWFAAQLGGIALWPASVIHAAMAVWCLACARPSRKGVPQRDDAD